VAAERLRGGERNLTDLALDLGYTDHSHFTKAFRQEWRLPPSAVRAWHHGVLGLQELARAPNGS
jgi:AraC-like DNA-binding protein